MGFTINFQGSNSNLIAMEKQLSSRKIARIDNAPHNSTKYARLKILLLQMGLEPATTSAITIEHDDIIPIAPRQLALVLFMRILYIRNSAWLGESFQCFET